MFEKVYEGTRESADGREFGVEIVKVTGKVLGEAVERFQAVVTDLCDNGAWGDSHFGSFKTFSEAMAYVEAL